MKKQCLSCRHSRKEHGALMCTRIDPVTGDMILPPRNCNAQRACGTVMCFLHGVFTGYDLCGKAGRYYEEKLDGR